MNKAERLERINAWEYECVFYKDFSYRKLHLIPCIRQKGKQKKFYSDAVIMLDTETSKTKPNIYDKVAEKWIPVSNYIVAWTISINSQGKNLVTLYGNNPWQISDCLSLIREHMNGDEIIFFVHFLSYDWQFLRKFLMQKFGTPDEQLNTKSHYPIYIHFSNGITLRDSLILAQRKLERWAKDMIVTHQKAVGAWDYEKIRNQNETFTEEELKYIEHDTLAGVECINAMMDTLHNDITSLPWTATGIPRKDVQVRSWANHGKEWFNKLVPTYEQYVKLNYIFHGGYTHGNRFFVAQTIKSEVKCGDFASKYPAELLEEKMPGDKFVPIGKDHVSVSWILKRKDTLAFMLLFRAVNIRLKDWGIPFPVLQFSKAIKIVNPILDNGRVLACAYIEIYLTEVDLELINDLYTWDQAQGEEVESCIKTYLPRWLTDYVYELFQAKCELKFGDSTLYSISKGKINSVYGMHVQKSIREDIKEIYETGDYETHIDTEEEARKKYQEYLEKRTSVLPFQIGVWVTAYAVRDVIRMAQAVNESGTWYYSDTDSSYGEGWDEEWIAGYNKEIENKLKANGYDPVYVKGRKFVPGIIESDPIEDVYTEFKYMGAKRYCGRSKADGKLHMTVAGVPKEAGCKCLNDDLSNFREGFIFEGTRTGKLTHTYINVDEIYQDANGNWIGDSVDLTPCDYELSQILRDDLDFLFSEEIGIQIYGEE